MPDTTLTAVLVGGAVAAIPTLATGLLATRAQRHSVDRTIALEEARTRANTYEDFMENATIYAFGKSVVFNAMRAVSRSRELSLRDNPDGAVLDTLLQLKLSMLSIHGSDEVADAADLLVVAWTLDRNTLMERFLEVPTEAEMSEYRVVMDEFLTGQENATVLRAHHAVVQAMRHDLRGIHAQRGWSLPRFRRSQ
jgi:hypothetical protein